MIKLVNGGYSAFIYYTLPEQIPEEIVEVQQKYGKVDLHLSLSKSFNLTHSYVQPFLKILKRQLPAEQKIILVFDKWLKLGDFLVLTVKQPTLSRLTTILQKVNKVLSSQNMQKYYDQAIFHVSVSRWNEQIDLSQLPKIKKTSMLCNIVLKVGQKQFYV